MTTEQSDATGSDTSRSGTTKSATNGSGTNGSDAAPKEPTPAATAAEAARTEPAQTAETEPAKTAETSSAEPGKSGPTGDETASTAKTADTTADKTTKTADPAKTADGTGTDAVGTASNAEPTKTAGTSTDDAADSDPKKEAAGEEEVAPGDPWAAFAPAPEKLPTRPRRVARRVGGFLSHEWTLATLGALILAVAMTWPTLRYPLYTIPQDYWDPSLQAWQMAWSGHILLTDPAQLWHSNAFFPERWSFAFSDTLLGYAPAGMIGSGPEAAVLRYNIVFVLAHALATLGGYALARQLGAGRIGAAVAGVSYTYAPWLLAQAGHLHVISNGGIPLALAMLARGHGWSLRHGYRPERRHTGWAMAGWLVAAWQLSLGFGIGLPFAYFLAGVVLVATTVWYLRRYWIRPVRRPFGARLLATDLVGGTVFAAVGVLLAVPYFKVAEQHPNAKRTIGDISVYSPPPGGFFTAPGESRIWGGLHEAARAGLPWHPEMTLLPGFVLYALAAGGLFLSVWRLRHRLLLLAGVLVSSVLAMGTRFFDGTFTYVPLFENLPGWEGLRTPGRLMLWSTLFLGLLAAGSVSAFATRVREVSAERIPSWPSPWLRLATLLPLLLVVVEGLNTTPHPVVPVQPAAMRTIDGPLLVLPSSQNIDQHVMLWSTDGFPDVVNGGSGFTPAQLDQLRRTTLTFPDPTSIEYLRTLGVRTVVLLRGQLAGTPWESRVDLPVESLGIRREDVGDTVVFRF